MPPSASENEVDDDSNDDADVIHTDQCYRCTKKFEDDTNGPMMEPMWSMSMLVSLRMSTDDHPGPSRW